MDKEIIECFLAIKNDTSCALVAHTCNSNCSGGRHQNCDSKPAREKGTFGIFETLSQKYPTQNRTGGIGQVVEHLPSKWE
jgi:hypothetical protein